MVAAAGVGRCEWTLLVAGVALAIAMSRRSLADAERGARRAAVMVVARRRSRPARCWMLLVRARHDPAINQGNPVDAEPRLLDVVARRQYDVAPLLPTRRRRCGCRSRTSFQYVDWQAAMSWGDGIMTSPARVLATVVWVALGMAGAVARCGATRRTLAIALATLLVAGTFGVAAYLNLKAGASLGWGSLPDDVPHEARERDYFFVLGFWAWGCLAGTGAVALARRLRMAEPRRRLIALALPLAGNWRAPIARASPTRRPPRHLAVALLEARRRTRCSSSPATTTAIRSGTLQQVEASGATYCR